ncbi:MAG: LptF/LptG family permease [Elusimicrobiota bacterium]
MKIITKYIIKTFLKPLITSITVFLLLFILSETFRVINIVDKSPDYLIFLPFYLLFQTPFWLTQIIPVAMLLAFLFSFGMLARHNEIIAIKAGGINLNKIFIPIIVFSLGVSASVLVINETIMPFTNKQSEHFYREKIRGHEIREKTEYNNVVYIGMGGMKYAIKKYNVPENMLYRVSIDRFDNNLNLVDQLYGENAHWKDEQWIFNKGVFRKFNPNTGDVIEESTFDEKIISLPEKPENFKTDMGDIDLMTICTLKKHINTLARNSIPTYKERSQLHLKIAFPFASTVVILIGIAFSASRFRTAKIISFAVSLFISFLYWGLVSVGLALGENRVLPPFFAAWLPNIIFAAVSIYYIRKLKK